MKSKDTQFYERKNNIKVMLISKICCKKVISWIILITMISMVSISSYCQNLKKIQGSQTSFQESYHQMRLLSQKNIKSQNQETNLNQFSSKTSQIKSENSLLQKNQNKKTFQVQFYNQTELKDIFKNGRFHIYTKLNCRLVMDMVSAIFDSNDLILWQWQQSSNQIYQFQHVYANFFYIKSAYDPYYMTKSAKLSNNLPQLKFQYWRKQLWKIVPAKKYSKDAFYILSQDGNTALTMFNGRAEMGIAPILSEWDQSDNQIWFIRKEMQWFNKNMSNPQNYQQKGSELLYQLKKSLDGMDQCISLHEVTHQMKKKNIELPFWMQHPKVVKADQSYLPKITEVIAHSQAEYENFLNSHFQNFQNQDKLQNINKTGQVKNKQTKNSQKHYEFIPKQIIDQCAQNHTVAYIWYSQKQMPKQYQNLLKKCQNNSKVLTQKDFFYYVKKWNQLQPSFVVQIQKWVIRQRINLLKLLYLYFQSGIYADFDTEINEKCFSNLFADQIIFTNRMDQNVSYTMMFSVVQNVIPEENFMFIRRKFHPQVKRMIEQQILEQTNRGGKRWKECKFRQCLIIQCQRHVRDNTYKKGYD